MRRRNENPTPQERLQDREGAKEASRLFGSVPPAKSKAPAFAAGRARPLALRAVQGTRLGACWGMSRSPTESPPRRRSAPVRDC